MAADQKANLVDLEKDLTCSICTEVLYQPLTLIDCLHSFCGSCLKQWFSLQARHARVANPYTCPSCRAAVLGTKPNALVTSILEDYLRANPTRQKSDADKADIAKQYTPGEAILRPIPSRRIKREDEDDQLLAEVRQASLLAAQGPRGQDRRSGHTRRERSRETRDRHEGQRRRAEQDRTRQTADDRTPAQERHAERRQQQQQASVASTRSIGHQSSLRSLLSASDVDTTDLEEEIARLIVDEGLLDGIDFSEVGAAQEEAIRERIDEAYRRRHQNRAGLAGPARRSSDGDRTSRRVREEERRQRTHSRSHSASVQDGPPRPTQTLAQGDGSSRRAEHRRRTSNRTPRSTSPRARGHASRQISGPARDPARSAIDLTQIPSSSQSSQSRPSDLEGEGRRRTDPESANTGRRHHGAEPPSASAERSLEPSTARSQSHRPDGPTGPTGPADVPASGATVIDPPRRSHDESLREPTARSGPSTEPGAPGVSTEQHAPITSAGTGRARTLLYPEPSISCARCEKLDIQYDLHYNCSQCDNGEFNICMSCYRQGRGCRHWYGFGSAAWAKYERETPAGGYPPNHPLPHTLTGHRFLRPAQNLVQPAASDSSRRPRSTEDPLKRLQTGVFCAMCSTVANSCFWRCDLCNDGEWGFCNACVVTGKCCSHALLPLLYMPSHEAARPGEAAGATVPASHGPPGATLLREPWVVEHGPLKPLSISTSCNICRLPIQPSSTRYHCLRCHDGNYDICAPCYLKLCSNGRISPEHGNQGWRRCLRGHRMIVVGFQDRDGGRKRIVVRDLVGGLALKDELDGSGAVDGRRSSTAGGKWSWTEGSDGHREWKFVSKAPGRSSGIESSTADIPSAPLLHFPPDGGVGMRVLARWSYYPAEGVTDELMFPRAAEIREVEDINGDWYWGCYAGKKGLFPGPYVHVLDVVGA